MPNLLEQNPNTEVKKSQVRRKIRGGKVVGSLVAIIVLISCGKYGLDYKNKSKENIPDENINSLMQVEQDENSARVERVKNNKVAYLTFDDGPNYNTSKILDILKDNNIKATFFLVGSMVENNPALVKRIKEDGHVIANHTYSHNYSYKTKEEFIEEVERTDAIISKALGEEHKSYFVRVPGGSMGKKIVQEAIKENNYKSINWTAKFGDDENKGNVTTEYIVNRVRETTGDDQYEVILAHSTKTITATVLQVVIDNLKVDGYIFEPLMEDSPVEFN